MRIADGGYRAGTGISGSRRAADEGKRFSEARAAAERSFCSYIENLEEEESKMRGKSGRMEMSDSSYQRWARQFAESLEQQALILREKLCGRVTSNGKEETEKETTSRVIVKGDGSKVLEIVTDTGGTEWKMYVEIEKGEAE